VRLILWPELGDFGMAWSHKDWNSFDMYKREPGVNAYGTIGTPIQTCPLCPLISVGYLAVPLNIFLRVFASALVASNMKAGAQGACNTVIDFGSGEGRIVALGPRSGGLLAPGLRNPTR